MLFEYCGSVATGLDPVVGSFIGVDGCSAWRRQMGQALRQCHHLPLPVRADGLRDGCQIALLLPSISPIPAPSRFH